MSMVKWRDNLTYRTVTTDSLKFSSPLITSVCPDQSNFRGSTPDSPVITSPKTRAKPYGSLSALGCSDVHDRAYYLPISWFSLGCSTDHYTAALMVISRKFGCYTSKASLYSWNAFIPDVFSSVLVDLMADLEMNSYLSFPGLVELIVPPEVILAYGSLSRPPESCFASRSQRIYSDMVFRFLLPLLTINGDDIAAFWLSLAHIYAYREGELLLANPNQNHGCGEARVMIHVAGCSAFCSIAETASSLGMSSVVLFGESYVTQQQQPPPEDFLSHRILRLLSAHVLHGHVCSFKELYLTCLQIDGVKQLKHSKLASHATHLLAASCILRFLKTGSSFVSVYWLPKQHDVVYRRSEAEAEYTALLTASWELNWFILLLDLHFKLVDCVIFFGTNQSVFIYHELQWQQSFTSISLQGQSRDFDFPNHILVAHSVWCRSILDFLYGSLPRPPDMFSDVDFSPLVLAMVFFMSKM